MSSSSRFASASAVRRGDCRLSCFSSPPCSTKMLGVAFPCCCRRLLSVETSVICVHELDKLLAGTCLYSAETIMYKHMSRAPNRSVWTALGCT
jgi:hypothetical protein